MAAEPVEDPRQLMAQFDLVQRQLQRIDRQMSGLEQALMEANQALATVKHLSESTGSQEVLLPIGSGVHVRARLDAANPVILPIGAGYSTEGPAASVAAALEERVEAITKQFTAVNQEAERLTHVAAALNEQIESFAGPQ